MKKFLFSAIVALFAVSAVSAQDKGNWALGPRMNIYTCLLYTSDAADE